ncbi:MAG: glycosyltransferase family 1 protein [Comamonadaceae bacterium]|nr:glycosyltransferase family 1 protein [Comamonadaceae bacterium]
MKKFRSQYSTEKWILITLHNAISQSQIYPFYFFGEYLRNEFSVEFIEIDLSAFEATPERQDDVAAVFFQFWIDKTHDQIEGIVEKIKKSYPHARLIFIDSFAPADLRYAKVLNPLVDIYIKKSLLKDRSLYGKPTHGDTNLSDWYGQHFHIKQDISSFDVPDVFLNKLRVGPSFFTAPYLLPTFWGNRNNLGSERRFDLHVRLGGAGSTGWYERMRQLSINTVKQITKASCTSIGNVSKTHYLTEMRKSMACFSPFGYGEICWRDHEAIAFGTVLIKPDMNHLETYPNIYANDETYIACHWDFSDLQECLERLLDDASLRQRVATNAFDILSNYLTEFNFPKFVHQCAQGDCVV